jgi:hypothetical protein
MHLIDFLQREPSSSYNQVGCIKRITSIHGGYFQPHK